MEEKNKPEAEYLFEASWEVCNKVGGIFAVVESKAATMKEYYKNYFLIGPYFQDKAKFNLNCTNPPDFLKRVFEDLNKEGIICHYGTWTEPKGEPNAILIDFTGMIDKKNDLKKKFWEDFGIDSINAGWDFEEPMLWSYAVGRMLEKISFALWDKKIVAQFHEWLSGFALLYLKKNNSKIKTVFTTHATMLGRTIAGNGFDLYSLMDVINPVDEAYRYKVEAKFLVERACAQNASVFTTVSQITSLEAEKILGKKADVILMNGLDTEKFPTIEETSIKHVTSREKIREVLTFYFFPYYSFDIQHNLLFFIIGRYEYRNKGIDIFIKALGKLNEKLKQDKLNRTVTSLFWIPMEEKGIKMEILENKNYYTHIKNYLQWNSAEILKRIVYDFISQKDPVQSSIFTKEFMKDVKKDVIHFKRTGNPPLSTHNLPNEANDLMVNALKQNGLLNREEDSVKVIINPVYLDGNDGLINLQHYDAMAGCHLGVFPSYYEPWGYTPLESAAIGVSSVTSDLSGFGIFIKDKLKEKNPGIYVLERYNKKEEDIVENFSKMLYDFVALSHNDRVENKINAKELSALCDWKILIKNYIDAHNLALRK